MFGEALNTAGQISLISILLWILAKIGDILLDRLINERVLQRFWRRMLVRFKAFLTRLKPIKIEHEFSIYLEEQPSLTDAKIRIEDAMEQTAQANKQTIDVKENLFWINEQTARTEIQFANSEPFKIDITLSRDTSAFDSTDLERVPVSVVGITTIFTFEFHELKGAILNLGTFARSLREGLEDEFRIRNITESQFTVRSLENELTLDDWIEEQRFDVSLLLQSENEDRSVRFYEDRAIVRAPYADIDDKTAEYIRLTLLNYYL